MVIDICAGWLPTTDKIGELKIARSHGKEVLSVEYVIIPVRRSRLSGRLETTCPG